MRAGFTGGVLIDYPNSSKAKKFFLGLYIFRYRYIRIWLSYHVLLNIQIYKNLVELLCTSKYTDI